MSVLDPLRGVAALAVACFHFTHNGWLPHDHWLARAGFHGHHGVQTFLVISGFVIPYAMLRGDYTVRSVVPFLGRRLTRIYPPYLASVLVLGVMNQMAPTGSPHRLALWDLASHFLFLNDILGRPWLMAVYWTLALEVQFYLLAGLAWPLLKTRRSTVFAVFALVGGAAAWYWPGSPWLVGKFTYFLLGIALFRQHAGLDKPAVSVGLLVSLAALIGWCDGSVALVAASLPVAAKFLIQTVSAPARSLGTISYSLYLFHLLAGASFLNTLDPWVTSTFWRCWLLPVALGLSVATAWLAYRCVEAPAIAWSRYFRYHGEPSRSTVKGSPLSEAREVQEPDGASEAR